MKYRVLLTLFVYILGSWVLSAQQKTSPSYKSDQAVADSTRKGKAAAQDSIAPADSTKKAGLEAPVEYKANDSIVMTAGNMAYLFGEGDVKYQQIQLQAEEIHMNMDSSLVFAKFGLDSVGEEFGYPLFIDNQDQYESKTMRYNFKTKKGYITDVVTQQGEGYVTAGKTKKTETDALNMMGGKYTTCDNHEHPHFYIQMTKAKVRPKKNIVTGPVYLVVEDVPLPLGLPFCFFPFSSSYSSGILMPTFGDESVRGFYLRDGGYYFALSDYMDLALTGEIYTKGSWGLSARSNYKKRYKYSGNIQASYLVSKYGDKGLPDYSKSKDFKIMWSHSQDPKANPFRTFSASVNFSTSSYDRNQMMGLYNPNATSNTKGSSVNITQRFPNNPLSISATMSINQASRDSSISVTLPDVSVTMSRIYPFKRKHAVGKERWYEKISMSYTGYLRNSINTKENLLFKSNLVKDWRNAMQHKIPVSATFTLFKYLNVSPSFNYSENWYTHKVEQAYDMQLGRMAPRDTSYGFYRTYEYDAALSASTTLYGFFKPLPFLGKKIEMIRHRFEPSISISARPDFGASKYGFWEDYVYTNAQGEETTVRYSPFANQIFSPPSAGKAGSLNFSLNNNLEMKVRSDKDSTGFKKISLIDKLSMGMSYNMVADSFKWSDLSVGLRLKFSKNYTLNLNGTFDTYTYGYNEKTGRAYRVDVPRWKAGKGIGRLKRTGTSFSYTFNNDTFKKWFGKDDNKKDKNSDAKDPNAMEPDMNGPEDEEGKKATRLLGKKESDSDEYDSDGYYKATIPWSLSFNYSMSLGYSNKFDPKKMEYKYALTHALSFNGNIQPTKNWNLNFNATYDFDTHRISYMTCNITRNMHCFQMSASLIPVGPYKSYTFSIAVSSSLLKDLKYNKSNSYREGQQWY